MKMSPHVISTDGIRPGLPQQKRRFGKRPALLIGAGFAALILVAAAVIGVLALGRARQSAPTSGEAELKAVQGKVAKHYMLPEGEVPALATVTDNTKLTTAFLKTAQNGDKVLIYQKNHIAILYRPQADRIVAVGQVSIDAPPASPGIMETWAQSKPAQP